MGDERSREFHWVDPHPALDVARKVGGLEYTRMVMRGEVPPAPVCELVGFRFVLVAAGEIGNAAHSPQSVMGARMRERVDFIAPLRWSTCASASK
jgi:hypothetical protein